jgi:hypothetical protein
MNAGKALLAIALAFGIWEATDIPHTGAPAAVFAALFLVCGAWFWRRRSTAAALVIAALCSVEASQAHTWKGVGPATKLAAEILGTAGILAAAVVVTGALRTTARRLRQPKGELR